MNWSAIWPRPRESDRRLSVRRAIATFTRLLLSTRLRRWHSKVAFLSSLAVALILWIFGVVHTPRSSPPTVIYLVYFDNYGYGAYYLGREIQFTASTRQPPFPAKLSERVYLKDWPISLRVLTDISIMPGIRVASTLTTPTLMWEILSVAYPLVIIGRGWLKYCHRIRHGLCLYCGYPLTGSGPSRCAECGRAN